MVTDKERSGGALIFAQVSLLHLLYALNENRVPSLRPRRLQLLLLPPLAVVYLQAHWAVHPRVYLCLDFTEL